MTAALRDKAAQAGPDLVRRARLFAFPHYWQEPAATEKAAYEALAGEGEGLPFEYVGVPWATVIDGVRGGASCAFEVLAALHRAGLDRLAPAGRRVTVAQHIHALQYTGMFKAAGITDLFWSHATHDCLTAEGIRIHPFPLYPAQAPIVADDKAEERPRDYLANFIGAYNPGLYLTNVRQIIFDDAGKYEDLFIIERNAWHFDRVVYEQQIQNLSPSEQQVAIEHERTDEYLAAIKTSWFTLCPTGSGPNSIRVFESLALGSIPIILTRDLRLAGRQELWNQAALIEEDSESGYRRSIVRAREMTVSDRRRMIEAGAELFAEVGPAGYANVLGAI